MGFEFNQVHSSSFGENVFVKTIARPLKSDKRISEEKIDGLKSSIVFNDGYNNMDITFHFTITGKREERLSKAREIIKWTTTHDFKELIIDDEPLVYYKAMSINGVPDHQEDMSTIEFDVNFLAKPFRLAADERVLCVNSSLPISTASGRLGAPSHTIKTTMNNWTVSYPIYSSNDIVDYRIMLKGTFDGLVRINGMQLTLHDSGIFFIDVGRKIVYKDNLTSYINLMNSYNKTFEEIDITKDSYDISASITNIGEYIVAFDFQNSF